MLDSLEKINGETKLKITQAKEPKELEDLRIQVLGRKGMLTEVLRNLSSLSIDERKKVGGEANRIKAELETLLDSRKKELENADLNKRIASEKIDVTLPPFPYPSGTRHPITQTLEEIVNIFKSLGYSVAEGPEAETDWYNFEALNIPKDHPARDTQDTFYLANSNLLLRTHTSPVQVHFMEKNKPPFRIVVPGKVFRHEATDASHLANFHQIEGLAVDKRVTFADLKGVLTLFIQRYFGPEAKLRFRPSHFQFTEPSAEVDIGCLICRGKGCRVCKNSGWLEMLGCGMVHPNVFKAVKYNPEEYTGLAFGIGVERFALLKYGLDDIRHFYDNNLQFLKQF